MKSVSPYTQMETMEEKVDIANTQLLQVQSSSTYTPSHHRIQVPKVFGAREI